MAQEKITLFENKRIVLGVTGSIAAYKAVDLASKLTQAGALVDVIMTEAAQRFVTPLAFQSVTGRPVYTDLWRADSSGGLPTHIAHVGLGEEADLLVIAPATANTIAKLTHGLADDLLSVTALAVRCPMMIAPAMDGGMYQHAATRANLAVLRGRGVQIIEPEVGRFASGLAGQGRLPETPALMGFIRRALAQNGTLVGRRVVVTAGGTKEPIDPVRYITNRSSGRQGYAVAQALLDAGAEVTLISTVEHLPIPTGATRVKVSSAAEMLEAVLQAVNGADALIMAAAVADFRPAVVATQKIKKSDDNQLGINLELARTEDILLAVKTLRQQLGYPRCVVGFAAESHDLLTNAASKLERKGLDFIVANDITAPDAGFEVETNRITILDATGGRTHYDLLSKAEVGQVIVERVSKILTVKIS
ncbi:MAG: peptidase ClpP [Chloroflexota bacterium]|nr:bifunctional phosphopantothenoylcysteine decarboxylase/phosphopantothenate--cysteine ligase CoaBC [Chloroflexota bacterium]NOG62928.1 bifunctional phosphopantothenoylcysteine decarboxylase/phosphopantothenate--cysteine ligase CoaBC [Chloroflexota bacterium]GIK63585.1 MAG: peptidase ClpP [Chloroflexota bacterium]